MATTKPVIRKCKICGQEYEKRNIAHVVCSPACAIEYTKRQREKKQAEAERKAKREERARQQARKNSLKKLSDWEKEAQAEVNRYIRLRDKGQPCISCGKPWQSNFQAGHYVPKGRSSLLRFEPDNIHGQCPQCNMYESGNLIPYRQNLVAKIGLERVEQLEANRNMKRWTVEELQAIKAEYKAKAKRLEQ